MIAKWRQFDASANQNDGTEQKTSANVNTGTKRKLCRIKAGK